MARQTAQQVREAQAAAVRAEQQAELNRLRAEKAAKTRAFNKAAATEAQARADRAQAKAEKAGVSAFVAGVQPEALHADVDDLFADMQLPSAKRVLVGFILAIASAGTVGYGIGMLLSYAIAGIVTLTATAWIAFALTVIAWIIAIYASWKIGGYVGGKVFASVVMPDGLASKSYESVANAASNVKSTIGGWFTSSKQVVAAKAVEAQNVVTGAFTKAAA